MTTTQIRERNQDWELFRDGSPGGETPEQMAVRVDALLAELKALEGDVLVFGHGHCFRAIAVRYLGLAIGSATNLRLDAGTLSILADGRDGPSLVIWNRRAPALAIAVAELAERIAAEVP